VWHFYGVPRAALSLATPAVVGTGCLSCSVISKGPYDVKIMDPINYYLEKTYNTRKNM